jgi:hypothetical protein
MQRAVIGSNLHLYHSLTAVLRQFVVYYIVTGEEKCGNEADKIAAKCAPETRAGFVEEERNHSQERHEPVEAWPEADALQLMSHACNQARRCAVCTGASDCCARRSMTRNAQNAPSPEGAAE